MAKLRYTITYEVDKDLLCDEETIKDEFNNSWQEWLDFFSENEIGEVITGIGTDPISILAQPTESEEVEQ